MQPTPTRISRPRASSSLIASNSAPHTSTELAIDTWFPLPGRGATGKGQLDGGSFLRSLGAIGSPRPKCTAISRVAMQRPAPRTGEAAEGTDQRAAGGLQ
jgi:hypothetical protein